MALTVAIGLTIFNSESLLQNKAFALDNKIVKEIREQCSLNKAPQCADVLDILKSFSIDNPTQIAISKPRSLIFINAVLLFLPPLPVPP